MSHVAGAAFVSRVRRVSDATKQVDRCNSPTTLTPTETTTSMYSPHFSHDSDLLGRRGMIARAATSPSIRSGTSSSWFRSGDFSRLLIS